MTGERGLSVPEGLVDPAAEPALRRVRWLAWFLDDAVPLPVVDRTVGADAFVGLVPVVGDVFSVAVSAYVLAEAVRFRAPPATLGRMAFNVAVDFVVGLVPLLGFVLDAVWAANERNAALLEAHLVERADADDADARSIDVQAVGDDAPGPDGAGDADG